MAQVTSPIILDSTGQQIHSDLQQIKNVLTTPSAAEDITFDNTGTGMQADDVQDAITELKSNLTELETTLTEYTLTTNANGVASTTIEADSFISATVDETYYSYAIPRRGSSNTITFLLLGVQSGSLIIRTNTTFKVYVRTYNS